MQIKIFVSILLLTIIVPLFAQNNMDILKRLDGEYPHSNYGYTTCALDFNDNIDSHFIL